MQNFAGRKIDWMGSFTPPLPAGTATVEKHPVLSILIICYAVTYILPFNCFWIKFRPRLTRDFTVPKGTFNIWLISS